MSQLNSFHPGRQKKNVIKRKRMRQGKNMGQLISFHPARQKEKIKL